MTAPRAAGGERRQRPQLPKLAAALLVLSLLQPILVVGAELSNFSLLDEGMQLESLAQPQVLVQAELLVQTQKAAPAEILAAPLRATRPAAVEAIASGNQSVSADDIPHAVPQRYYPDIRDTVDEVLPLPTTEDTCNSEDGAAVCWQSGCFAECSYQVGSAFLLLSAICMGADTFGRLLASIGFPAITTFILFGILCGPFFLGLMQKSDNLKLEWINQMALGFIGLTAGGKLHVSDLKLNLVGLLWVLFGTVTFAYLFSIVSTMLLGPFFMAFMAPLDFNSRVAVALLMACLAVARSPSSAIAIIEELHAKGPFTTVVLTVTVFVDVVVVLFWALTQLLVTAICPTGDVETAPPLLILLRFVGQTIISVILGCLLGKAFSFVMFVFGICVPGPHAGQGPKWFHVFTAAFALSVRIVVSIAERLLFLVVGYLFFVEEDIDKELERWQWQSPMIVCMVTGFVIVNFTHAGEAFSHAMHDIANPLYLIFFTYTGLTMDILSLARNWLACILLFFSRATGIFYGSRWGGILGKQPLEYCKLYWMSFLTQAGVSLGLALSVPDAYPWKPDFVACSVALIVCNQVVGPPLFKWAIKLVKEDNHGYHPKELQRDGALPALAHLGSRVQRLPQPRGGLIIGHEKDEVVLSVASKLRALRWEVVCADANLCAHPEHDARPRTMPRPKRDAAAEQRSAFNLGGLSSDVREKVKVYRGGKALVNTYQSLPVMSSKNTRLKAASPVERASLPKTLNRTDSFHQNQMRDQLMAGRGLSQGESGEVLTRLDSIRRITDGLKPLGRAAEFYVSMPERPELPKKVTDAKQENPDFYSRSMRLLWLIASMRNIDVIVVLLPTDEECAEVCELVSEMLPLVKAVRHLDREELMPQVVVALKDPSVVDEFDLEPAPLVISEPTVLQSLVCEILHPTAHWTGSLNDGFAGGSTEHADGRSSLADQRSSFYQARRSVPGPQKRDSFKKGRKLGTDAKSVLERYSSGACIGDNNFSPRCPQV